MTRTEAAPTLRDAVRDAATRIASAGSDSARREAEELAAHALGVGWGALHARLDGPVPDAFADLVARRCLPQPAAYVLGTAPFWDAELACGPGVLVPRPETETLVEVGLRLIEGRPSPVVVDVGTGTGAVAIAVARSRPDATVWATERSPAALAWAERNIAEHAPRVRLGPGELLSPVDGTVDLVLSNPPYVPEGRADLLAPDVRAEPPEALFAGADGDDVWRALLDATPERLARDGAIAVEVGTPEQADRVLNALRGWTEAGVDPDRTGRPRVVWGRR